MVPCAFVLNPGVPDSWILASNQPSSNIVIIWGVNQIMYDFSIFFVSIFTTVLNDLMMYMLENPEAF